MIEREKPTHAAAVPTIWQGLLGELTAKPRDVSSLTQVTIGGSACPPSLMEAFDALGMRVCHAWGMTETSPLGTIARPPAHVVGTPEEFAYRLTQGRFPAGVEARLTGPGGERLPWDGESAGELEVRGPWIAGAYYNGPDAEPLRPADKFSEDGWLKTGDVGTISADGFLTLTDRAKDVIKSGGEWISSVELENALMSHPDVTEAAVVAVPDDKWGERPWPRSSSRRAPPPTSSPCAPSSRAMSARSPSGSSRSAGRSSRRSRRRASESSTRRCCASGTRRGSWTSPSSDHSAGRPGGHGGQGALNENRGS